MTSSANTTAPPNRWVILELAAENEARIVDRFARRYPQLGEITINELLTREVDAAARPIGEPGSCPDLEDPDRILGWLDYRLNLRCLDATSRKRFAPREQLENVTIAAPTAEGRSDDLTIIFEDILPRLHANERRYLVALAACNNPAEARDKLGWSPRQWRRWQASANAHIRTLKTGGVFGVLPLPLIARIWATMTPDRIAAATATGGAAASGTGTLLGGAGAAKIVAGIAALTAAAGGVITAEHQQQSRDAKPTAAAVPAATPVTAATATNTTAGGAAKPTTATRRTSGTAAGIPPLATKTTATTDFKPAGGTAQKTRGGSSDFIPDGPTPVTKTYTPQSPAAAGSNDFATP